MNKNFYLKLAWNNIKNNKRFYLPYIISALFTVITFFTICTIQKCKSLENLYGGSSLIEVLMFGCIIIGIFAVIFLFYTNGFLIKQRKKELGLYCILGLEKKHLAKVMICESIITVFITVIGGMIAGTILSKLLFLILLNIINFDISIKLELTVSAYVATFVLFLAIFVTILLRNIIQVHLTNPIDLLKGSNQGEKEPKASVIFAILGMVLLGIGYYMALSITNPLEAILYFFVAVIFVICGTHLIFASSSVFILKFLKKRKSFYYKPKNFISVSGMIYRMKQNAAGLANICILSTMVIVCVLSTFSLYIGEKDVLKTNYPRDIEIREKYTGEKLDDFNQAIDQTIKKHPDVTVTFRGDFVAAVSNNLIHGNKVTPLPENLSSSMDEFVNSVAFKFVALDDFNQYVGESYDLESENQVLLFDNSGKYHEDTIEVGGKILKVKENLSEFNNILIVEKTTERDIYLVVKDIDIAEKLWKSCGSTGKNYLSDTLQRYYYLDIDGDEKACIQFEESLRKEVMTLPNYYRISRRHVDHLDWYSTFGGMLFIGAYFGIIFLMATVLIIYYKQITEGYDDHDRFQIMQKVGMSRHEVKSTIHKQILMVFTLPLAVAALHTIFALPMLKSIFMAFHLYNTWLVNTCALITVVVYGIVYAIVYGITAKAYTRIVE